VSANLGSFHQILPPSLNKLRQGNFLGVGIHCRLFQKRAAHVVYKLLCLYLLSPSPHCSTSISLICPLYSDSFRSSFLPLLYVKCFGKHCNGVMQPASIHRLGKHVPEETNAHNRIAAFSMWSTPRPLLCSGAVNTPQQQRGSFKRGPYRRTNLKTTGAGVHSTRVEAGSNTSTVTLRVVGGDKKVSNLRQ
jgi:hypothetical protein